MKTRRLTKKYKNKSNRKSIKNRKRKNKSIINYKNKSRKRILKGGTFQEQKKKFLKVFFEKLESNKTFPHALCALHTFYTCGIPDVEIKGVISSDEFKRQYELMFYRNVKIPNAAGGFQVNIEAREKLILFLSYIFKKIAEGEDITCNNGINQTTLSFTPGPESFLKTLKKFFGYLDTACVLTRSYSINQSIIDKIEESTYMRTRTISDIPGDVKTGQMDLYELYTNLKILAKNENEYFDEHMINDINSLLELMTTDDVYSFNTSNMCTLIKMTQGLFTYFYEPAPVEPEP